jgi:hypothetical protein
MADQKDTAKVWIRRVPRKVCAGCNTPEHAHDEKCEKPDLVDAPMTLVTYTDFEHPDRHDHWAPDPAKDEFELSADIAAGALACVRCGLAAARHDKDGKCPDGGAADYRFELKPDSKVKVKGAVQPVTGAPGAAGLKPPSLPASPAVEGRQPKA